VEPHFASHPLRAVARPPQMRLSAVLVALLSATVSARADVVGTAKIIDGDTIVIAGEHVRLQGIDAPETDQTCTAYGQQWSCGRSAADWLKEYLRGRQIDTAGCWPSATPAARTSMIGSSARDGRSTTASTPPTTSRRKPKPNARESVYGAASSCHPGSGVASAGERTPESAMRGLTVRHPYMQAIACGLKRIETRGQRIRYRGRLAIHAALGYALPLALADLDAVLADCRAAGVDTDAIRASLEAPDSWSFGKIIAAAELSDCVPVEELTPDPVERALGDYARGPFGCGQASPERELRSPLRRRPKRRRSWPCHRPARAHKHSAEALSREHFPRSAGCACRFLHELPDD
jgi:hypothetical protein